MGVHNLAKGILDHQLNGTYTIKLAHSRVRVLKFLCKKYFYYL